MTRKLLSLTTLLFPLYCVLLLCTSCDSEKTSSTTKPIDTLAQLVHEVTLCSRLYTTEYSIHKIAMRNDVKEISMSIFSKEMKTTLPGNRKIVVPFSINFRAYIDFAEFSDKNVVRTDSSLTIFLPDPHLLVNNSHIEHKDIRQYISLHRNRFSEAEITEIVAKGKRQAIADIQHTGIFTSAKQSAARTLLPILQRLGYKEGQVHIVFRKEQFSPSEIQRMITYAMD